MVEELRNHTHDGRAVILSNGITVLQLILMPAFKALFAHTNLVEMAFQFLPVGVSHGHAVFLFD